MIVKSYKKRIFNVGDTSKNQIRSTKHDEAFGCNKRCTFFNKHPIYWINNRILIDHVKLAQDIQTFAVFPRY